MEIQNQIGFRIIDDIPIYKIRDLVSVIEECTRRASLWRFLWATIETSIWHLWHERNYRWHTYRQRLPRLIGRDTFRDL